MRNSSFSHALRSRALRSLVPIAGCLASFTALPAFASGINPGDVVVVRVGTGSGALGSAATAVFLDEYTTSGTFVQTIALPTAVSGSNKPLTNSGSATSEGYLSLSSDGQYLIQVGYAAVPGTASIASTTSAAAPRVVARTGLNGLVDTSTALSGDTSYSGNNVRSATSVDGAEFWLSGTATLGTDAGVRYVSSLGGTTSLQLSSSVTNTRNLSVQNGQLYVSTSSGSFKGVNTVGSGTPTTSGQTTTLLPGFPSTTPSQYDFYFADATTLYVAEDGASGAVGGIEKWTLASGTWTRQYTLSPGTGIGCRGLTGSVINGATTLFATTTQTSANKLVSVLDAGAGSSFVNVATAAANTVWRGVRYVPCTIDSDGDGTPDCYDGCPNDAAKTSPGVCGCGVADTDTDGDGTADCTDGCPNDAAKTAPGACGCGVADTDTDGDGTPDCNDGCPLDSNKLAPGQCGCGTPDTDSDGDGTADCNDGCPNDAAKTSAGICGCGVSDVDSDGDGVADCNDGCPSDANKTAPGTCGCGVADTDSDGDGLADCVDGCPNDASKSAPGQCGCGVADTDTDGDGVADCNDGCPNDANKTARGQCGCGVADTDTDGDGVADCNDGCPNDANKTSPGICGCGVSDVDSDGDGVADCHDGCPSDPNKTSAGICGCGVSDVDSDGDGTADCQDGCPNDANKTAAGICGCGVADTDTDGDGTPDCNDGCPNDPAKIARGQCGCGVADTDTDGDGTADCHDGCPNDALKTAPGQCGCGNPDTDTDGDGIADCHDNCVNIANPGQEDCNQNSIGDVCDIASGYSLDANADSIPDDCQGSGVEYCFGDGSGAACPCGNTDGFHGGCKNSTGNGARLYDAGGTSFSSDDAVMTAIRLPLNKSGLLFMGKNQNSLPFGDGRLCISTSLKRFAIHSSGASGSFVQTNLVANSNGAILSGSTWNFQAWYRDPQGPCGGTFNLSNAVQITFN